MNLHKDINSRAINAAAKRIFECVKDKINKNHSDGKCEVLFKLPFSFNFPGLSNEDAQLVVYAAVIEELEKLDGVKIGLIPEPHAGFTLKAEWKNQLDKKERERCAQIIKSHILNTTG